jgi:hypothetical protein
MRLCCCGARQACLKSRHWTPRASSYRKTLPLHSCAASMRCWSDRYVKFYGVASWHVAVVAAMDSSAGKHPHHMMPCFADRFINAAH